MKSTFSKMVVVAVGAMLLSCGGSDTTVELPFDDSKSVKDLTEDDLKEVCKAGLNSMREAIGGGLCSLMGLGQSLSGKGTCEEGKATCLDETFNASSCDGDDVEPMDCDATVGEIEACMNDMLQLTQDLMPDISCSSTLSELEEIDIDSFENIQTPASCRALETKCGELELGFDNISFDDDELS